MTKIALITGANKGIGLETARQLAAKGIHVIIGARDAAKGEAAAKTLQAEGYKADFIALEVSNEASVKQAAQTVTVGVASPWRIAMANSTSWSTTRAFTPNLLKAFLALNRCP